MSGTELPLLARRQRDTLVAISDTALDLFAAKGFAETTVKELAHAAGVSVRTFHRYFATKEDAVAPVLDSGWQVYVDAFAGRPTDEPVSTGLVAALSETFNRPIGRRHRTFLRALPESPELEPVWLQVNERCASGLRPALAARLGFDPSDARVRFAAACVIAANKLAVETWARQPRTSVASTAQRCLSLLEDSVLRHRVG